MSFGPNELILTNPLRRLPAAILSRRFVINPAQIVAGKTVGGPAWLAVFASALTGTISGSAIADTASIGVITIPLMKKPASRFAAGVEAAASTGAS